LHRRLDELTSAIDVRRATAMGPEQLREATATLTEAFRAHPLFACAYPDRDRRRRASEILFSGFLKDALRHGIVELAYDGAIAGVLVAYPPGGYPMSLRRKLRRTADYIRLAALGPAGLVRLLRIEHTLLRMHPAQPHYYACLLAAAPGQLKCAGLVLGKRLVDLAHGEGFPVYLEAQERSSAEIYRQFGGCILLRDEVELFPGGPVTWTLLKEPPAASPNTRFGD
jgi:hypothetical protein